MERTPIELRATCSDVKWMFTTRRDQGTYIVQGGIVGIGNDGLEVPEDLSFSEDGAVLTVQYIEPVFAASKFPDGSNAVI